MTVSPDAGAKWTPEWTLGERLRKIRRHLGISQSEFAELIEQNPKSYSSWESDQARPRQLIAVAKRIEIATGVGASWTLGLGDVDIPGIGNGGATGATTVGYPAPSRHLRLASTQVQAMADGYHHVDRSYCADRPSFMNNPRKVG